jgi:hypothetical protein
MEERAMRGIAILTLVGLLGLAALFTAGRAGALPLQAAPAIGEAAGQFDAREDVRYLCRRVWRCGRVGCAWRRACSWTPRPYAYVSPYPYFYPYAYRPYWGSYPRHRAWRYRRYWY